jgi:D-alanine-D-alanine ligase-like ATP-grasp enzyme
MFLPGRNVQQEREDRQREYRRIEEWSKSLIVNDVIRQACEISVQEIQCGDPNCAPVDTVVTIAFES